MALLDAAYRTRGTAWVREIWPVLRDLAVAYRPPSWAVVTNLFTKVLKPSRSETSEGAAHAGPLSKTIGYREYVYFSGAFGLALGSEGEELPPSWLAALMACVSYLGKRGGFIQLVAPPRQLSELEAGFVRLNEPNGQRAFALEGALQTLDDCGPKMTLEQASIYSPDAVRVGRDRLLLPVVLPYRLERASKSYTLYRRIDH